MSIQDKDKQKAELEKTLQKFTELLPSVSPEPKKIDKALVIINGTAKSRAAVLLARELNRYFQTYIDVVCFYTEQKPERVETTKESYEDSLAFAYEHLKSEDFEIKGQIVENVEMLKTILDSVLKTTDYDLIIIPSSFIGIKETKIFEDEEEDTEASITVMGDIFEYLLDFPDIPLMLVESEKLNIELLWKNICIFFSGSSQINHLVEKALKFSVKKAEFHLLINIAPSFHEDKNEEEFEAYIKKNKEDLERFERANLEVFKEASRFVDFHLISTDDVEVFKSELLTFGKDVGILIIHMPSKHSSLYGFFIDLLEDAEITFPILISKKRVTPKIEEKEEEKEFPEVEEKEEIEEVKIEEKEKIVIDEGLKETIKEEIKKDILGELEEEIEEVEEVDEVIEEVVEEKKEEEIKEEEEMKDIDEIKEEVKEEVIEEIKKEVKKEIKDEPKREVKKEVSKELKKEESMEELKETIIEEIKEEIVEEIKYELKKDLKEPKKELKSKVIEEIKEEADVVKEIEEEMTEEEKEEEEEVKTRRDFE